jgi:hypothetical protein
VITLQQTYKAVCANITSSFLAGGGTAPYTYAVRSTPWVTVNGQFFPAGGAINSSTGLYTAPAVAPTKANSLVDVITVTDSLGATATAQILIGDPLLLFCDIIQTVLALPNGRVYLWDQKLPEPDDDGLFVIVSILSCKPFGNNKSYTGSSGSLSQGQSVNMFAQLQMDIISRDASARVQKEQVLMALTSDYSEQQQEANSFSIGRLPPGSQFTNLSQQDGAAIPYRFVISIGVQYFSTLTNATGYMIPTAAPTVNYSQA